MRKLSLILMIIIMTHAKTIQTTAVAEAPSKQASCSKATELAKEEALLEAGTNIFSTFESSKTIINGDVSNEQKKYLRQSSFGLATLKNSDEMTSYNNETGSIKCSVSATFEVDTSRLKTELEAISAKNEAQKAVSQTKIDNAKRLKELTDKYNILKQNLLKTHTYNYQGTQICDSETSPKVCTSKLKKKIINSYLSEISDQYTVDKETIKASFIAFAHKPKINFADTLIVSYQGETRLNISYIANPYIDEINQINRQLGRKQTVSVPTKKPTINQKKARRKKVSFNAYKNDNWYLTISSGSGLVSYAGLDKSGLLQQLIDNYSTHDNLSRTKTAIEFNVMLPINKRVAQTVSANRVEDTFTRSDTDTSISLTTTMYNYGFSVYGKHIGKGWFWQGGAGVATTELSGDGILTVSDYGVGLYGGAGYAWEWGWGSNQVLINFTTSLKRTSVTSLQITLVSLVF